ncbi:hypothetical protein J4E91_006483 [Alternaria rosae]|nr:hypothetical protein J4E91_006483 [Alternaria rosae]
MQFTQILLLAIAPFMVAATPVDADGVTSVNSFPLEARGGKDFCGSDLRSAGAACTFGGGENDPHACGVKDRQVVLYCKGGVWTIDHRCAAGQICRCNKGTPKRGDLVCKSG